MSSVQQEQQQDMSNSPHAIAQQSPLQMTSHTSPNPPTSTTPPADLAIMTNVSVLDLHKNFPDDTAKVYEKTNAVYVYSTETDETGTKIVDVKAEENGQVVNPAILQRLPSDDHHIIDGRMIADQRNDSLLNKLGMSDDQILRLLGPNGENQQIISREIINGEHHILTRNENGEHIITRIVSADPKFTIAADDNFITQDAHQKIIATTSDPGTVYISNAGTPAPSVLQYDTINKTLHQHIFTTTTTSIAGHVVVDDDDIGDKDKQKIIYAHAPTAQDQQHQEQIKEELFDEHSDKNASVFEAQQQNKIYEDKPIDLIYEEGGKTVIYTTSGEQKQLELYQSGELGIIGAEGQVMVPSGIQYATQQINGQTVFVVADQMDTDINEQLQR